MRLTPQQSQLEVESSSPESLAPTTPVRNGDDTKKWTINVESSGRSALHSANDGYDDCYAKLTSVSSMLDRVHAGIRSPSSPSIRSRPDASDRRTSTMQADRRSEERTLDDELLDFVEDSEPLRSIDIKLPPRHTLEPDVSIAMAVLNNELSPHLQPGKSTLAETGSATESTGNGQPLSSADVLQRDDHTSPAGDVIEVLVEGEPAKDPYRAPSLTQLDTRLRSGLTKFVFLAPGEPGPVRGALVTRASPSSQRSDPSQDSDARGTVADRASTGRQGAAEATKSPRQSESPQIDAEGHDPQTGTLARRISSLLMSPASCTGDTSATEKDEESARRVGMADLAGTSCSPRAGTADRTMCLQDNPPPEQHVAATKLALGHVACASTSHPATHVAQVAVAAELVNVQAAMVDCACQADLMAWPCATLNCKKRSERFLTNRHCLGQVERFEVLEKPNLSHSSTGVNASGSPLCWECGFEHRRQVARSRKQRARARRHLQRSDEAINMHGKRELEADSLNNVLEPPAKRPFNVEAAPYGLLLTSPISYQLVQANDVTPELFDKTSQQANAPPASIRTPVLSKRILPVRAQPTSKACWAETASSSTQTEERLQRTERAVSSCSTAQTPSSRHASKTPSPLRAVQTVSETLLPSPPPSSPSAERCTSDSGVDLPASQHQVSCTMESHGLMEQCLMPVKAHAQSHHDNQVFSVLDASKNPHVDTEKQNHVLLHFCECGRDLARFAEKLPCKTCMNEQYWQLLAKTEEGDAATGDDALDEIARETPHSAGLCYICSKLVAFDENGLCIPCANPLVSGLRNAAKMKRRNKKRCGQSGEQSRAHINKQVPSPAQQVKKKPLKGILKRR